MNASKRTTLAALLTVAVASAGACGSKKDAPAGEEKAAKNQVVMIIVDTLRVDHLGCYGYEHPTSPKIDALAADSIVFENAHAAAPWTEASIASMVTGVYPRVLGITKSPVNLPDGHTMLAERFEEAGYETGAVISHDMISKRKGFSQGFDMFDESQSGKGHLYVSSPRISKKAVDFIDDHKDDDFFLFLHYFDPHWEYLPHKELNTYPDYAGKIRSRRYRNVKLIRKLYEGGKLFADDMRYMISLYDSEIRFTDTHIGTVLDRMRKLGIYDDATVILVADHGEEFGEREDKWIGHAVKVTQELIRVPLMIKLPGEAEKKRVAKRVSLVDLAPTILSLAGLKGLEGMHVSGSAWNLDDMSGSTPDLFAETWRYGSWRTAISDRWKYLVNFEVDTAHLYDLDADPYAWKDVIGEHPEVAAAMKKKLEGWETFQDMAVEKLDLEAKESVLSKEEKAKLEALGYIVE